MTTHRSVQLSPAGAIAAAGFLASVARRLITEHRRLADPETGRIAVIGPLLAVRSRVVAERLPASWT